MKIVPQIIKISLFSLFLLSPLWLNSLASAQDITLQGGDLSSNIPGRNGLQAPAPNISSHELLKKQVDGFGPFHSKKSVEEGLGPFFINSSCGGCHVNNGKGNVRISRSRNKENHIVVKVSLRGLNPDGSPRDLPDIGEQLKDRMMKGSKKRRQFKMRLRWRKIKGRYPDGSSYTLRKPRLTFRIKRFKRNEVIRSLRMTPPVVGVGLLESIPEEDILKQSDPYDSDNDQISGVPNYVPNKRTEGFSIGRFGFRASHPTVEQQTAAASFHDMGVTNTLFNNAGEEKEMSDNELELLTVYQMLASVPMARNQGDAEVIKGKSLFKQIGCNDCHVMTQKTKNEKYSELDGQTIHPFTDLLLHDMGPGLADKRAEFSASGSEWKTTPLWGLGFVGTVSSKVNQHYLHDGRAKTIEEAILWHGGEAKASQERFKNLEKSDRQTLIKFLKSL